MAEKKETNVTVTEDNEMDLITGLLKAAEYKTEVQQPLNITRNGQTLFKFNVRPLSFDEIAQCRKKPDYGKCRPHGTVDSDWTERTGAGSQLTSRYCAGTAISDKIHRNHTAGADI